MNTFKRKSLYAVLAGLGAFGAAGVAQAVNVNPDGLGQVLIYPYYTVNSNVAGNAYNSLLSVVNSTSSSKAVKVRILEGRNSREVLDFNLFLSPYDVWTAAIFPSPSTGGGRIATDDQSCILPRGVPGYDSIRRTGRNAVGPGVDFVNFGYTALGGSADNGGSGLERTREGYVEIIEMAVYRPQSLTAQYITHSTTNSPAVAPYPARIRGVPLDCDSVTEAQATNDAELPPSGGLFGGISLINVNSGTDYTEDAVALDNFLDFPFYTTANSVVPNLADVSPKVSVVLAGNTGVVQSDWSAIGFQAVDPVSAVLMRRSIMNEYVLDKVTASGTDWVITMPTKRFYVASGSGSAIRPFQSNFVNAATGSCDSISAVYWDREEQQNIVTDFSPPRLGGGLSLCYEANVLTFNNSHVLASQQTNGQLNTQNLSTPFQNGWLNITFPAGPGATHTLTNNATVITPPGGSAGAAGTATYYGLPVIGFAVQSFTNGNVGGVLSNYGGNFVHKSRVAVCAANQLGCPSNP